MSKIIARFKKWWVAVERAVQSAQCALENLRVDIRILRTHALDVGQLPGLRVERDGRARALPRLAALLQRGVVQLAETPQDLLGAPCGARAQPHLVFEGAEHV